MANKKALKIMYWNANGIASKQHEFFNFMDANKIQIAALNETFLKCNMRFSHCFTLCGIWGKCAIRGKSATKHFSSKTLV